MPRSEPSAPVHDARLPATVPTRVMMKALQAYQGIDELTFPQLDYRRLSHAIAAALEEERQVFRDLVSGRAAGQFGSR